MEDYLDYADLERYLFGKVGPKFRRTGTINSHEFFCIIIWKANRSKSIVARRLIQEGKTNDLERVLRDLCGDLASALSSKDKLDVLMRKWSLRLPMATAILTVLYPDDFSVYDVRVCDSLDGHKDLVRKTSFEEIWDGYQTFLAHVRAKAPAGLALRDKDRWLWGKSFVADLRRDIERGFRKARPHDPQRQRRGAQERAAV